MSVVSAECLQTNTLRDAIERGILSRTGRRIRSLRVIVTDDAIAVTGEAVSYYHKQLAVEAVLDCIRTETRPHIELDIMVQPRMTRPDWD